MARISVRWNKMQLMKKNFLYSIISHIRKYVTVYERCAIYAKRHLFIKKLRNLKIDITEFKATLLTYSGMTLTLVNCTDAISWQGFFSICSVPIYRQTQYWNHSVRVVIAITILNTGPVEKRTIEATPRLRVIPRCHNSLAIMSSWHSQ